MDKKEKKMKNKALVEALASNDVFEQNADGLDLSDKKKKKSKSDKESKKRKAVEVADDGDRSETSSELGEPVNSRSKSGKEKKSSKKVKVVDSEDDDVEKEAENPNAVTRFRISEPLKAKLKEKGISSLFPIQAMTFDTVYDGSDLVGRARTGQGKTLAFVLPILESLVNGPFKSSRVTGYGRSPSVIVLLPTRELADQVFEDFKFYGRALGLDSCCLCGGMQYGPQEIALKRGVDIVVGTPGRVKDHINRNNIDLRSLKFRVLDEADEMLNMGFVDDVEFILGMITSRFLKASKKTVDLVGNEKMKASKDVRHIVIPCSDSERSQLIPDIIRCYSSGGRTIIFTETKESASELAGLLPGARPLHGDIQQSQRSVTISGFRSGKFLILVATNVAARGLDINDVQLIIQCEAPKDIEAYIHRSGRTGRAGNTGVAVTLYDPRKSGRIARIERDSGVKFEHLSAPQPIDIAKSAGASAAESVTQVSDSVIPPFKSAAEEMVNSSSLSAVELLAKALAKLSGYTEIKSRSLLTSMENHVTLILEPGKPIYSPSFAYSILRRFLPEEKVESVKGMSLTADGYSAVFDVKTEDLDAFLTGQANAADVSIEVLKSLPKLQDREQSRGGRFGGGGRGGFGDRRNGGSRFSGGRGGGRGGFSDRNNRFSGGRGRNFGGGGSRSSW
uniref:DEAD-box ATP-dependent RNA helicase 7 n=1 Tax=Cucumis melo TaxID=3656 RepID=A0A9I9CLA2_CUCME